MKRLWLIALLPLSACGSAPSEPRQQLTEIRMPPGIGCDFDASWSDAAEIGLNADRTVEISTWGGEQANLPSKAEIGRSLYAFGINIEQTVYVRADVSAPYGEVVQIMRDLSMRGYEDIRLRNTPL
ncbi:biopolymer transporter ExbD [Brevundimonas nasdae]|uniref:biopolymer transporter ExbD n=1 Tax=Brevundimonas nasdae TaxID=172043 RepID=UPI0028A20CC4|nr:biopolymer transporter ExbD [Brevundimonas nasdae]